MSEDTENRPIQIVWWLSFFAYGILAHILLFQLYKPSRYATVTDDLFRNSRSTLCALWIVGGYLVAWAMTRFLAGGRSPERNRRFNLSTFLKAGLLGVAATWMTLMVFYAVISVFLSIQDSGWLAPFVFLFVLLGIVTYGGGWLIVIVPLAFAFGAGAVLLAMPLRRLTRRSPLVAHP